MESKNRTLLVSSLILLPFTFGWFQLTTLFLGTKWGYVTGFLGYWAYCLFIAWRISDGDWNYFKSLWDRQRRTKYGTWIGLAAFFPAVGVFFISFLPNVARLSFSAGALLIGMVVVNGFIEELYWRGLYLLEYPNNAWIGFLLSWLLFGAWHISLWFARGILYKDGFLALVGGSYGLGLLWTWVARSNGNLRAVIPAHILANLFAFTALFVDNGF